MAVLLDIFEGGDVAEGDVGAGVSRTISFDCVGEGVGLFEEGGEVFAEVDV